MALSIFSLMGSIFVDSSEAEESIAKTEEKSNKLSDSLTKGIETAGKWAGGIATAAGAAALALGTAAVNVATDVDSAMNGFAAATGTAVDELGKYEEAMLNIYNNNFGESFDDIANSMTQIKQVMGEGMGAEELEQMTTNALMLRDTFEFDVAESVRAANSLMDQFGITGEEAYNLIAQGAQKGLNQNGDMLDVINEYSVQFEQMGYSAEDMFNMLANGAENGTWSIDKLGDAAKEFNIRMSDGSAKDAVEALGFSWDVVSKNWSKGGEDAKQTFNMLLNELDGLENTTEGYNIGVGLLGTMFEDMGMNAVLALSDTQGEISNTKDALAEINEVKYDDIGSMIEGLKRNFETLILPLGNALIPLIMQFVQIIQDNMPMIQDMIGSLTPIITDLFGSLMPPLLELISTFLPSIMEIVEMVLPVLIELINILLPPITDIANMILPLLITLIQPILELLQPIINLLNPIIELCMNLIVPLMELLEKVLPPLNEIITFLVKVTLFQLQTTFQTVSSIISNVVNVAVTYITNQFNILKSIFNEIIDFIKNVFTGNWSAAFENLKTIIGKVFEGMINAVKTPVNTIIGVINGLISGVTSGINAVINSLNKLQIDVPEWVTKEFGIEAFGFNLSTVSAPQIPYLAKGGTAIEGGSAIVGEAGAELINLPKGASVTPLTGNNDPLGYNKLASKLDVMIELLAAIYEKEGVLNIGETQFVNYINKSLGALL